VKLFRLRRRLTLLLKPFSIGMMKTDTTASPEDQAGRKRRLIRGPEEFQNGTTRPAEQKISRPLVERGNSDLSMRLVGIRDNQCSYLRCFRFGMVLLILGGGHLLAHLACWPPGVLIGVGW
jgi:hypothetical protein